MMKKSEVKEMSNLINICHANLSNSKECMSYLNKRNITEEDIKKFKIGYFPRNTNKLNKFVSKKFLKDKRIMNVVNRSKFAERYFLILPIYNEYKEPVAIMGRTLLDEHQRSLFGLPKYESSSYKKSNILYGFEHARPYVLKKKNVFVVEGNFDVMAMSRNGLKNVVGICGSSFSRIHFYKLARYANKISFILDADEAGEKAMEIISKKYSNKGIKLRFYHLPKGYKDADEYFSSNKTHKDFIKEIKQYIPLW